jgi:two-component system sensor histidine kinase DesK
LRLADVKVERRCEPLEMPPSQERVLALIVREAVTNVLRHSQATACRLTLLRMENALRLEIADDGRGGAHREGVGMRSIRTRAEALGGTAEWSSGDGTRLCVTLPIPALERA